MKTYLKNLLTVKNILIWVAALAIIITSIIFLNSKVTLTYTRHLTDTMFVSYEGTMLYKDMLKDGVLSYVGKNAWSSDGTAEFYKGGTGEFIVYYMIITFPVLLIPFIPNKFKGLRILVIILVAIFAFLLLIVGLVTFGKATDPDFAQPQIDAYMKEHPGITLKEATDYIKDPKYPGYLRFTHSSESMRGFKFAYLFESLLMFVAAVFVKNPKSLTGKKEKEAK